MTHPNLILKRMQFPTIHIHTPSSRNSLTRSYKFGHYRSILKVNENTFFSKAHNLRMEYKNEMRPKVLVIGHLKLSIKSKKTSKVQNWRSYALLKLGIFPKLPKVNYPQNFKFCQMGSFFSTWFDLVTLHTFPSLSLESICQF